MRHDWPTLLRRAELAEFTHSLMPNSRCKGMITDYATGAITQTCDKPPVPGLELCWWHAGTEKNEQLLERGMQRAAEARALLSEAAPLAAARLAHVAMDAERDRDAITAAAQVLDRAGVGSRQSLDVNIGGTITHVDATPVLRQLLDKLDTIERRRNSLNQSIDAVATEREPEPPEEIPPPPPVEEDDEPLAEAG